MSVRTAVQQKAYLDANPDQREKHRVRCRLYNKSYINPAPTRSVTNPETSRLAQSTLRSQVIHALGDKCSSCGFSDTRALQVDHPAGGGTKQREQLSWSKFYRQVILEPHKFQLLCANCNWIKRHDKREACGRPRI